MAHLQNSNNSGINKTYQLKDLREMSENMVSWITFLLAEGNVITATKYFKNWESFASFLNVHFSDHSHPNHFSDS